MTAMANDESFVEQAGATLKRASVSKQGGSPRHVKKVANNSPVKETTTTGRSCHRGTCLYPTTGDRAHATSMPMEGPGGEQRPAGNNTKIRVRSPVLGMGGKVTGNYSNQVQPNVCNRGGGSWQEAYLDIKRRSPYRYQCCTKVFDFLQRFRSLEGGFTLGLCIWNVLTLKIVVRWLKCEFESLSNKVTQVFLMFELPTSKTGGRLLHDRFLVSSSY